MTTHDPYFHYQLWRFGYRRNAEFKFVYLESGVWYRLFSGVYFRLG